MAPVTAIPAHRRGAARTRPACLSTAGVETTGNGGALQIDLAAHQLGQRRRRPTDLARHQAGDALEGAVNLRPEGVADVVDYGADLLPRDLANLAADLVGGDLY